MKLAVDSKPDELATKSEAKPYPSIGTVGGYTIHNTVNPRKLEHGFRMILTGIPILGLKGMRIMMFQLSGFYCNVKEHNRIEHHKI